MRRGSRYTSARRWRGARFWFCPPERSWADLDQLGESIEVGGGVEGPAPLQEGVGAVFAEEVVCLGMEFGFYPCIGHYIFGMAAGVVYALGQFWPAKPRADCDDVADGVGVEAAQFRVTPDLHFLN